MSSIMVRVESRHRSFWGFLVRLCGLVGGIFATSGRVFHSDVFINRPPFFVLLQETCHYKSLSDLKVSHILVGIFLSYYAKPLSIAICNTNKNILKQIAYNHVIILSTKQ